MGYNFVRMRTVDLPENVLKVELEVNEALGKAGYGNLPGNTLVKRWMRECPDQDWSHEAVRCDNTHDIISKALTWAKKRGFPRKRKPKPSVPKEQSWAGLGLAYATVSQVQELVETVREEFWGTPELPFETSPKGQGDALAWLQQAEKEDEAALGGQRPGWVTLSMTLAADNVKTTFDALEPLIGTGQTPKSVAAALAEINDGLALNTYGGKDLTLGVAWRRLQPTDAEGWIHSVRVLRGTRLARLNERVGEICRLSRWWNETEALVFLMCGLIPPGAVRTTVTHKGDGRHEITVKVVAPTTAESVAERYQRALDEHRLNPKTFSGTQRAILELLHDTPSLSWPQRYSRWLDLCVKRPNLPRLSSPDSLRIACERALKRASWGEGKR